MHQQLVDEIDDIIHQGFNNLYSNPSGEPAVAEHIQKNTKPLPKRDDAHMLVNRLPSSIMADKAFGDIVEKDLS